MSISQVSPAVSASDPDSLRRLSSRLESAYRSAPFYRERFDDAGIRPGDIADLDDFANLPLLSKEDIIADQNARPPYGGVGMVRDLARVHVIANAYYMCFSHGDLAQLTRMFREAFETLGVRCTDIVDVASAYHWVIAGTQMDAALRSIGAAVIPAGPGQSGQRLRVIKETGVTVLQAFTPYAEELATRFSENGIDPDEDLSVRLLLVGGELRESAAKARLEAAWGGAVAREFYGVSEAGLVAAECFAAGDGMHVGRHCIVEVVDPVTGKRVAYGEPGEVVTTELYRDLQPFIRYRSGDITEGLSLEQCECGRSSPRLGRIIGRNGQIPRVKGLFISPARVEQVVRRRPEAHAWRMVIDRPGAIDRLTVEIEWAGDRPGGAPLEDAYAEELKGAVGIKCEVRMVNVATIGPDSPRVVDRRVLT